MYSSLNQEAAMAAPSADPEEGGGGGKGSGPPLKNHKLFRVSIGNKQLDTSWKKLDPLEKIGPHLEPWKTIDFFEIDHLTSVK